jgi:hypothetical protein
METIFGIEYIENGIYTKKQGNAPEIEKIILSLEKEWYKEGDGLTEKTYRITTK